MSIRSLRSKAKREGKPDHTAPTKIINNMTPNVTQVSDTSDFQYREFSKSPTQEFIEAQRSYLARLRRRKHLDTCAKNRAKRKKKKKR